MNTVNIVELFEQIESKSWWGSVTFEFKSGQMTATHVVQTIRHPALKADNVLLIVASPLQQTPQQMTNGALAQEK